MTRIRIRKNKSDYAEERPCAQWTSPSAAL